MAQMEKSQITNIASAKNKKSLPSVSFGRDFLLKSLYTLFSTIVAPLGKFMPVLAPPLKVAPPLPLPEPP